MGRSSRLRVGFHGFCTAAAPPVFTTKAELREWRKSVGTVALVPTMGNLHAGHLSLVKRALDCADHVVVSIFVNPTQFAAHEDFGNYPRTLEADLNLLSKMERVSIFHPEKDEMYRSDVGTRVL